MRAGMDSRTMAWSVGIVLGLLGAALDFYSSYLILTRPPAPGEMGMVAVSGSASWAWGIGIASLGAVLAVTSVAFALSTARRMRDFGALMMVYGLVMLFIGGSMYAGITTMSNTALLPAMGMLAVGALMLANGAMMRRSYMRPEMT